MVSAVVSVKPIPEIGSMTAQQRILPYAPPQEIAAMDSAPIGRMEETKKSTTPGILNI